MKSLNFNSSKNKIFLLFNCFLIFIKIKSLPYFQTLPAIDNRYYIIFSKGIMFLNNYYNNFDWKLEFADDQIIANEEESEKIYLKNFDDDVEIGLLIVKDYVYGLLLRGTIFCSKKIEEINGFLSVIVPIKNVGTKSYYVIGLKNSNNKLSLYLYENDSNIYGSSTCNTELINSLEFNSVSSYNINCHYGTSLICFYENDSNQIVASYFNLDINDRTLESSYSYSKGIEGAKILKSIMSPDGTKYYVCYIKYDNNTDCLIFDINENKWSNPINYLNYCIPKLSSLNIKFFDSLDYILLSCFRTNTKIQIIKLNNDFEIMDDEQNGLFYVDESLFQECEEFSLASLVNDTDQNIIKIFGNCNYTAIKYEIIKIPDEDEDELEIIQMNSYDTKEEIINNINNALDNYDLGKTYEIFGDDYKIKISKINSNNYKNISTYIDFSNCEQKLRAKFQLNDSYLLTVFQIEIENPNNQRLIYDTKYVIFNEDKQILDLSVCEDETIDIYYKLNTSMINIEKINHYSELGIDIFNIKDNFFNDICYSYSENGADMILNDRISDIYENYSLCENNCYYVSINLTLNTSICKCFVKTSIDSKTESPTLSEIIKDSFKDSNLGVIVCYKLVFSLKNKLKNYGFWIFTILIIIHFPLFIYYFKFNIFYVQKYIFSEMNKYNYWNGVNFPLKKKKRVKINLGNDKNNKAKEKEMKNDNSLKEYKLKDKRNIESKSKNIYKSFSTESNINSNTKINRINLIENFEKQISNRKSLPNNLVLFNQKAYNKNYRDSNAKKYNLSSKNKINVKKNKNKIVTEKEKEKSLNKYSLIQMDANNSIEYVPINSNMILDIYDYKTAIEYDKRNFWRILYICIITKENILNIILFKTPLDIQSLRISLFIFCYSCDLAFNTIFYSNENISEKYHYTGNNLFIFTIVHNFVQSFISSIISIIIINIFQNLIDSRDKFEDIFREEEEKMRNDKKYKVSKSIKLKIKNEINKISSKLKCKIRIYIIIEFVLLLFFYYFVIAFCEVYNKTQTSWLLDFVLSFFISIAIEIGESLVITTFYKLSLKYKLNIIYKIVIFFYNL